MTVATIYCAEHCNLHKMKGEYIYLSLYLKRLYFMMKGMLPGLAESGDVSWVPHLILYLREVWTGMDHFLVLASVLGTTSSCVSPLVNPGDSSKISKLITRWLSVSGSCVFCLQEERGGPGLINLFGKKDSPSDWSQSEHTSTSWPPLWPSFYNTKCPPCSYGLYTHLPLTSRKEWTR